MRLDGDLYIPGDRAQVLNACQKCSQLSWGDGRGSPSAEINAPKRAVPDQALLPIQGEFTLQCREKGFCAGRCRNLQVEGAEVTALSAERDVDIEPDVFVLLHELDLERLRFAEVFFNDDFNFVLGGFSSITDMRGPARLTA